MPFKPNPNIERKDVPETYKWRTTDIFKTDEEWHSFFNETKKEISQIAVYNRKLSDQNELLQCLNQYFQIKYKVNKIFYYSHLKNDEDMSISKYDEFKSMAINLLNEYQNNTTFIKNEIMAINNSIYSEFIKNEKLKVYQGYMDNIRRRRNHLLHPEAENIMSSFGDALMSDSDAPHDSELIFNSTMLDLDLPFVEDENNVKTKLTISGLSKLRTSENREVRKKAVESFFTSLGKYQNILANTLASQVKFNVNTSKLRKYNNSLSAFLDVNDINPVVYDNLISTVNNNLSSLHDYVSLKAKYLKIEDFKIYDLNVPFVKNLNLKITYEECVEDVRNALTPLGKDYNTALADAIKIGSGWVDVFSNKNKQSGAYSSSMWKTHPFIKLNYNNTVDSVFTTAHEFGHAMHSFLNSRVNPYHEYGYSIFTAEIASNVNELLLEKYYLKKYANNKDMILYFLGNRLDDIRASFFRQTKFAEFERRIHKIVEDGMPLSAKLLNKEYAVYLSRYFGKSMHLEEYNSLEWAYIPHFYYKYYVYCYATGLSSAIAIANKILNGEKNAVENYLNMLTRPYSSNPIKILKDAGVDLTSTKPIEDVVKLFNNTMNEFKNLS